MKDQMPNRGVNRLNPAPEVEPCFARQFKNRPLMITPTYGMGVPYYNRAEFRKLKKEARNYRGNAERANRSHLTTKS